MGSFPAFLFPFMLVILVVTGVLHVGIFSGWFSLMNQYPDRFDEEPIFRMRFQSGMMGWGVWINGILRFEVCPSGLRVGIMRMFAPFCQDFFVPWGEISVIRTTWLFIPVAVLRFGDPRVGSLTIFARVANKLAGASVGHWPESGSFPAPESHPMGWLLFIEWLISVTLAALLLLLGTRIATAHGAHPPLTGAIAAAISIAVFLGVLSIGRFLRESA